jgi:hypothetical protein
MRFSSAFYILLASGRLSVDALPCVQKTLSSSSPYPPSCRMTSSSGSGAVNNATTLNELFSNTSPQHNPSENTYLTPTLVLTLVLFIVTASLLITLLFFGPNIRSFLLQKMKKEEKPKLGFGFDGLSKQELKGLRLKEEQAAAKTSWLTKLPVRPPALVLKHSYSPILPIQIPTDIDQIGEFHGVDLDDEEPVKTDSNQDLVGSAVSSHEQTLDDDDSLCKVEIRRHV